MIIESQNVEEVIRKLRRMGIPHILVNWSEMKRLAKEPSQEAYFDFPTEKGQEIQRNFFSSQYLRHLISRHQVDLYEVLYHDTP